MLIDFAGGATRRSVLIGATLLVIAAGLALRLLAPSLGAPFIIWKYGGSVLWATMVYLIVAALVPSLPPLRVAVAALIIAVVVEFFRLYHTPWLDAFRLTMAGKLLIGRVFSSWNILAYAVGIAGGAAFDRKFTTPPEQTNLHDFAR